MGNLKFSFPKSARILKRANFRQLAQSQRYYGRLLTINYLGSSEAKLGITVSRKFGNAVQRNYFKRVVREAFRLIRHELPPFEMAVTPQKGLQTVSLDQVVAEFLEFSRAQSTATKSR